MFYSQPIFLRILTLANKLYGTPLKWDPGLNRVVKRDLTLKTKSLMKLSGWAQFLLTFSIVCQVLLFGRASEKSVIIRIVNMYAVTNQVVWVLVTINHRRYADELITYINAQEQYCSYIREIERRGNQKQLWHLLKLPKELEGIKAKLIYLLAHSLTWACVISATGFNYGIALLYPCTAASFGYWIFEECKQNPSKNQSLFIIYTKRVFVTVINHWIWQFGLNTALFAIVAMILGVLNLCIHLQKLGKLGRTSSCPGQSRESPMRTVRRYRQLQILARLHNNIQQKIITTAVIISAPLLLAFSTHTVVKSPWNVENAGIIIVFGFIGVNCIVIITTVFGGFADVCSKSKTYLRQLKRNSMKMSWVGGNWGKWTTKWYGRFWKSCSFIRIRFGAANFVEPNTPLRCLDCAVNLTVNLLLLKI